MYSECLKQAEKSNIAIVRPKTKRQNLEHDEIEKGIGE